MQIKRFLDSSGCPMTRPLVTHRAHRVLTHWVSGTVAVQKRKTVANV